jgi:glycosyltransferase involved in cell wall biosynthesis
MPAEVTICALIPVFNEADAIASVVRETKMYANTVVVVDDGSNDGTAEQAETSGAECLRLAHNCGKGAALREGIAFIQDRGFSHVLFLDGDGQHRPSDIPSLLCVAREKNADMVIGSRTFDKRSMPRERFLSNSIGSRAASLLLGMQIKDSQSGFRLIRLEKLRRLKLRAKKYEIEMEILIKMRRAGCSIVQAPVSMIYDKARARSKMKPVRDAIRICFWSLFFRFLRV